MRMPIMERITVTLPADLVEKIDQLDRNSSTNDWASYLSMLREVLPELLLNKADATRYDVRIQLRPIGVQRIVTKLEKA